jgi:hypothetical protein
MKWLHRAAVALAVSITATAVHAQTAGEPTESYIIADLIHLEGDYRHELQLDP